MTRSTSVAHDGRHPPNLLILGASGNVARALLRRLGGVRARFGRLTLLDKSDRVLRDRCLDLHRLDCRFVHRRLRWPEDGTFFRRLLRRGRIGIVLDLTDMDTLPVLAAAEAAGVSYVGTSLNDDRRNVVDLLDALHPARGVPGQAPHIVCSGMNPGVVNVWVWHAVRRFGVPQEIVHFEVDTSMAVGRWRPIITWSRREFLREIAWDPTGRVVRGRPCLLRTCALENQVDMTALLSPIMPVDSRVRGCLVLHEENLFLGRNLGVSSRFLYAIHPNTLDHLVGLRRTAGRLRVSDLEIGDNTSIPLTGSDTVGVCLDYPRQRVYYLNRMQNDAVLGANATCSQVSVGVYAALFTLLRESLAPRVHFTSDLYDTVYPHILFDNLRVEYFMFKKRKRSLILHRYVPALRLRSRSGTERLLI